MEYRHGESRQRQTDTTKNITFPRTTYVVCKIWTLMFTYPFRNAIARDLTNLCTTVKPHHQACSIGRITQHDILLTNYP